MYKFSLFGAGNISDMNQYGHFSINKFRVRPWADCVVVGLLGGRCFVAGCGLVATTVIVLSAFSQGTSLASLMAILLHLVKVIVARNAGGCLWCRLCNHIFDSAQL